jgi:hypothetical protein
VCAHMCYLATYGSGYSLKRVTIVVFAPPHQEDKVDYYNNMILYRR